MSACETITVPYCGRMNNRVKRITHFSSRAMKLDKEKKRITKRLIAFVCIIGCRFVCRTKISRKIIRICFSKCKCNQSHICLCFNFYSIPYFSFMVFYFFSYWISKRFNFNFVALIFKWRDRRLARLVNRLLLIFIKRNSKLDSSFFSFVVQSESMFTMNPLDIFRSEENMHM